MPHATMEEALELLHDNHIPYELLKHEAVWNMADATRIALPADLLAKNLLLRNKRTGMLYMNITTAETKVNWSSLARELSISRSSLTFASDDDLEAVLGVKSGIVTPLALMHDNDISVTVLLDRQIEKMPKIGIHPNTNEATIFVTYADLLRILSLVNHEPIFID